MRSKNSLKNIVTNISIQIVIILLGFISRKVFIDSLGQTYLGVNALLTSILSMLGLVEGGIGVSIVYNLYKPLAEKDEEKIIALVQLYKKLYFILSIIIFILSLALYPFIGRFIKGGESIPLISIVYFIFVIKNMISYLNAHKWSLINADQKEYVIARYNLVFNIVTTVLKILVLKMCGNYIYYLLIETFVFAVQNIANGFVVDKRYPYIKTKKKYCVEKKIKDNLVMNTKSLFLHNIGSWCVYGTDNLLISYFVGLKATGLYSNYVMLTAQLSALIDPVISSMGASIGNLIATESSKKKYDVFKVTYLINFWLYSISVIFLFNLVEPFINWWIGYDNLLDKFTFVIVLVNLYLKGMRNSILIFKYKGGIFKNDRYAALVEAIINLVASLILVRYFGLVGILLGTTISTLLVPFWIQAKVVYKYIFNQPLRWYFAKYILYAIVTIITGTITTLICSFVVCENFISLIIKGTICIIIPNVVYLVLFHRSPELHYITKSFKSVINYSSLRSKIFKVG